MGEERCPPWSCLPPAACSRLCPARAASSAGQGPACAQHLAPGCMGAVGVLTQLKWVTKTTLLQLLTTGPGCCPMTWHPQEGSSRLGSEETPGSVSSKTPGLAWMHRAYIEAVDSANPAMPKPAQVSVRTHRGCAGGSEPRRVSREKPGSWQRKGVPTISGGPGKGFAKGMHVEAAAAELARPRRQSDGV